MKFPIFPQLNEAMVTAGYRLPVTIQDPDALTEADITNIETMKEVPPETRFKEGDLCLLKKPSTLMRRRFAQENRAIPRMWKVRHTVSVWAWELSRLIESGTDILGIDHATALLEDDGIVPAMARRALIYCHGYPHALYPNTASWFHAASLQKLVLRESNLIWPEILNDAKTSFVGYESPANTIIDLAPDRYGLGTRLSRPFQHEEATTQAAASLGLEELMWVPMAPMSQVKRFRNEEDAYEPDPTGPFSRVISDL